MTRPMTLDDFPDWKFTFTISNETVAWLRVPENSQLEGVLGPPPTTLDRPVCSIKAVRGDRRYLVAAETPEEAFDKMVQLIKEP